MNQPRLLTTRCTCLGRNPTCFKCNGWGYIDSIGAGTSQVGITTIGGGLELKGRDPGYRVPLHCPHCQVTAYKIAKLRRHVFIAHGSAKAAAIGTDPKDYIKPASEAAEQGAEPQ